MAANSRRRQEKVRCGAAVVIEISSTLESDNPIGASSQRHGPDPFDGPSTSRQDAAARQPSPMRLRRLRIIRARHDSSSSDTSQGSTTHPARRFGQVQVSNQISPVMVNGLPGWIAWGRNPSEEPHLSHSPVLPHIEEQAVERNPFRRRHRPDK